MTTVVNSPRGEDSGVGMIVTVLVIIVLLVLFFVYALPAMRGGQAPVSEGGSVNVDLELPSGGGASTPPAGSGDGN